MPCRIWILRSAVSLSPERIAIHGWAESECRQELRELRRNATIRQQWQCGWKSSSIQNTGHVNKVGLVDEILDKLDTDNESARTIPFVIECKFGQMLPMPSTHIRAYLHLPYNSKQIAPYLTTGFTRVQRKSKASLRVRSCMKIYGKLPIDYVQAYLQHIRRVGFNDIIVYALEPITRGLRKSINDNANLLRLWNRDSFTQNDFRRQTTHTYRTEIDSRLLGSVLHCLSDAIASGVDWMMTLDFDEVPRLNGDLTIQEALLSGAPLHHASYMFTAIDHRPNCFRSVLRLHQKQYKIAQNVAANLTLRNLLNDGSTPEVGWTLIYRPIEDMLVTDMHGFAAGEWEPWTQRSSHVHTNTAMSTVLIPPMVAYIQHTHNNRFCNWIERLLGRIM